LLVREDFRTGNALMNEGRRQAEHHRIACFISPHGFGHAARAAAVMEALGSRYPSCHFDIFTTVPPQFFEDSLSVPYSLYPVTSDIGLVQKSAFVEDLDLTLERLNAFLPFDPDLVSDLSRTVIRNRCELILCDIAPLGIAVGRHCGVPTVLIENFTWDFIYGGYPSMAAAMGVHIDYLHRMFSAADHHIQTEPVCFRRKAGLIVGPISRRFRSNRAETRQRLRIPFSQKIVLVTTGGIPGSYRFLDRLASFREACFILPGSSRLTEFRDNTVLLPHHSDIYHPDLVNASDVVIGKAGYSTIAEVYSAGVPFGYVARKHYPESPGLVDFIDRNMDGIALGEEGFNSGRWVEKLPQLLSMPRQHQRRSNGSEEIAAYIGRLIEANETTAGTGRRESL